MLTKILSNFSEDELLSFLPKNSIKFILQLDAKYNQVSEGSFHSKNKLTGITSSVKHGDFIFNSQLRNKLIDSLSAAQLAKLLPSFEIKEKMLPQTTDFTLITKALVNSFSLSLVRIKRVS